MAIISHPRSIRAHLTSAVGVLALFSTTAFIAPGAARHIGLASSSPAKDSHVTKPVSEVRLTFTGTIDVAKAGVELLTAAGKSIMLDSLRAVPDSNRVAVAKITGALGAGTYTVKWHAVAADGADGSGSYSFMYMPPAKGSDQ